MCILQRYALLLIALFAFIGAAMRTRRSITVLETLVVICALAGVGVAGHHVYTQFYPAVSCGIDVLQPIVDGLPLAKIFPLGFQVDGFCSTPYPPILGLSLAQWALVAFVLVVVLVPLLTLRNRKVAALIDPKTPRSSMRGPGRFVAFPGPGKKTVTSGNEGCDKCATCCHIASVAGRFREVGLVHGVLQRNWRV